VGKTTLAHALAKSLGLRFNRVQFTADLMPSDLTGVSIYDRTKEQWIYHAGPLFTQVLLADEINRASPKTQSALLEAMEEKQVTAEGQIRALPAPFFVLATQNPHDALNGSAGTNLLPESQLDRFLMRLSLGYPDAASERKLLLGWDVRKQIETLPAAMNALQLAEAQSAANAIHASPALLNYVQYLIAASRSGQWFARGISPRAALGLLRAAKAYAYLGLRDYVSPDDIRAVAPFVMTHRLQDLQSATRSTSNQLDAMLASIPLG
jgi:MoxR-like ATPase